MTETIGKISIMVDEINALKSKYNRANRDLEIAKTNERGSRKDLEAAGWKLFRDFRQFRLKHSNLFDSDFLSQYPKRIVSVDVKLKSKAFRIQYEVSKKGAKRNGNPVLMVPFMFCYDREQYLKERKSLVDKRKHLSDMARAEELKRIISSASEELKGM